MPIDRGGRAGLQYERTFCIYNPEADPILTYNTTQVHNRLHIPKPTIRSWTATYAEFLSAGARPAAGRTRRYSHDDLIVLNTVRHLTRIEGVASAETVAGHLRDGLRVPDLPEHRADDEAAARDAVELVPVDKLERALDHLRALTAALTEAHAERDRALAALGRCRGRVADLQSEMTRLKGALLGAACAVGGLLLLLLWCGVAR